jgi:hypothetical protein
MYISNAFSLQKNTNMHTDTKFEKGAQRSLTFHAHTHAYIYIYVYIYIHICTYTHTNTDIGTHNTNAMLRPPNLQSPYLRQLLIQTSQPRSSMFAHQGESRHTCIFLHAYLHTVHDRPSELTASPSLKHACMHSVHLCTYVCKYDRLQAAPSSRWQRQKNAHLLMHTCKASTCREHALRPKLAASITPDAKALHAPNQCRLIFFTKKKGMAPKPCTRVRVRVNIYAFMCEYLFFLHVDTPLVNMHVLGKYVRCSSTYT